LARLYTSTSFRPIINDRLDPVSDEAKEAIIVGRTKREQKREGFEGLLDIGVVCEKQASGKSYHGYRVYMDAKFPHIVFICGRRGGGKSYTLGVIAEELCKTKIGIGTVIVDPIGIYWSMKKQNQNKKEIAELKKWGLKPLALDNIRILGPLGLYGQDSDVMDGSFSIRPSELTSEEWCLVFGLDRFKIQGLLIGEALDKVRDGYKVRKGPNEVEFIPGKGNDYTIGDIVDAIDRDVELGSEEKGYARTTRRSVIARFKAAERWGIFSEEGTPIEEISVWDRVTVIDVSHPKLENQIRALIVGILAKKILQARMLGSRSEEIGIPGKGSVIPVTWLMIDEAHLLIPRRGLTAASKPLIEYAKLGRKPGCALVLATQRPAATDDDILSQIDILIGHSLGLEDDISALLKRVPAKIPVQVSASDFIRGIPSGFALLADQKTQQRTLLIQIRPRLTHHSGKEATPAKQVVPKTAGEPPTTARVRTAAGTGKEPAGQEVAQEIKSIWGKGGETGVVASGASATEEEFEILSASAEIVPEETEGVMAGTSGPEEAGQGDAGEYGVEEVGVDEVPQLLLGEEPSKEDESLSYADDAIIEMQEAPYEAWEESEAEEAVEEESEDEAMGLEILSESGEADGETVEFPVEKTEEAAAPVLTHGPSVVEAAFPVVLSMDSAKGLAIKGLRTGWTGKPKEFVESIELVYLPMYEVAASVKRKKLLSGFSLIRCRILVDAHLGELVTDFYEFKRSMGVGRLLALDEDGFKILSCLLKRRTSEDCAEELGVEEERVREGMQQLSEKGIISLSEDKKGRLSGVLSKGIAFPERPENVKGQLPSSNPTPIARRLEERADEASFRELVHALYPEYRQDSFRRVYMPYYEITYASEEGSRREYVNAFTGLFEELEAE